jgi:hypothetical protein
VFVHVTPFQSQVSLSTFDATSNTLRCAASYVIPVEPSVGHSAGAPAGCACRHVVPSQSHVSTGAIGSQFSASALVASATTSPRAASKVASAGRTIGLVAGKRRVQRRVPPSNTHV